MKKLILIRTLFLVFFAGIVWGQIPQTMSYQGILKTSSGTVVTDGNYQLAFNLYDVSTSGTTLWTETHTTVAVSDGVFNVILGSITTLNLAFDKQYWLGVTVSTDSELSPRVKLTASPYSLNAQAVLGSSNTFPSSGNVGIGTTSPSVLFHLQATNPIAATFERTNDTNASIQIKDNTNNAYIDVSSGYIGIGATGSLNATNLNIDISGTDVGNVGIGTTTPAEKLDVAGTAQMSGFKLTTTPSSGYVLTSDASGVGTWQTAASGVGGSGTTNYLSKFTASSTLGNSAIYESSGNVGIGTTSPSGLLTVRGSTQGVALNIFGAGNFVDLAHLDFDGLDNLGNQKTYASVRAELGAWTSGSETGRLTFSTINSGTLSERMRIIETGNVGIGTTSPSYKLDIVGTVNLSSGSTFKINGTDILSASSLGSSVTSSSLTSVGTLASGVWNATAVGVAYGGTGAGNASGAKTNLGFMTDLVDDTSPQLAGMLDVNGNAIGDGTLELLIFSETASAVNELTVKNAATGGAPEIQATGGDTNIDLELIPKGTGVLSVAGTTNYESNVSADDDIPNKKWIDDQGFGVGSGDITAVGDAASGEAFTADGTGNSLTFEGTTANSSEIVLVGADPGADVTVTIPASTGTLYVSGGTDVAVADGGTGASTAADARTSLELGSIATQASSSVSITGGSVTGITDLTVADGGTGASSFTSSYLVKGNGTSALSSSLLYDNGTNVGIGTTSPGNKLVVAGAGNLEMDGGGYLLMEKNGRIRFYNTASDNFGEIYNPGSVGDLAFIDGSGEAMRLVSGNVGIGTATPAGQLEIEKSLTGSGTSYIGQNIDVDIATATNQTGNLTGLDINLTTAGTGTFSSGITKGLNVDISALSGTGTKYASIFQGGNVGIGTATPAKTLDVAGDVNISSGSAYGINGTDVLSGSALGTGITASSLTSVGTLTSGTWNATAVGVAYGGTGAGNASGAKTNLGFITDLVDDTTPQLAGMLDVNGNAIGDGTLELLKFSETASAVNELTVENAATGGAPEVQATGGDANIDLELIPKGTGVLSVAGTTNYESNVSADDDIPNKKWIDDQGFGVGSGDITAVGDAASGEAFTADGTGNSLTFEGTTANSSEIVLVGADPGADVTVTIPASTGTLYISGGTDVAVADGGTGASTAADARTSLGFGSIATQASSSVSITGGSVTGITDLAVADGGTGASTAADARTSLGLGSIATQASSSVSITGGSVTGITDLTVADGGTGTSSLTSSYLVKGNGTSALSSSLVYDNGTNVGIGTTSPNSTFEISGSIATSAIRTEAGNYTASATDHIILASTTSGQTITLPTAVGIAGRRYIIKKIGTPAISVDIYTTSSQTIDGSSTALLMNQWAWFEFISDGSNWLKISSGG